ncbi:MAG: hypothetical protein FWG47_01205, partial [Propionibacteriaceae bacterium]|nr:hypothetical protein [Propionibacteriaceae bacterium]
MKIIELVRESFATAWAAKISSLLSLIVVGAMCATSLVTVGRSAGAAAEISARMEAAGARRLSIVDTERAGFINARTLAVVTSISTVESAIMIGVPFDVSNGAIGAGGARVPTWPVLGELESAASLVRGRLPNVGEAIVSTYALVSLGLAEPVGYVTSADGLSQYPIVGSFTPKAEFGDLGNGVLTLAAPDEITGRELRVLVDSIAAAAPTVTTILTVLHPPDLTKVVVESPAGLAAMAQGINADMASYGRSLLVMIMAVGGLLVAAVVLADVLIRRRDLGRRRTLGITRTGLASIVTIRTLAAAIPGAAIGASVGWAVNYQIGQATGLTFAVAIAVL